MATNKTLNMFEVYLKTMIAFITVAVISCLIIIIYFGQK